MEKKYTIIAIIVSFLIGIALGYIICSHNNGSGIIKDVTITNPAAW